MITLFLCLLPCDFVGFFFEENCACLTRYQEHRNNQISSVAAFWGYCRPLLFCYLSRFGASDISYSFG